MKKIIALALALIMVLSMGVVALAETTETPLDKYNAALDEDAVAAEEYVLADEAEDDQLVAPGEKFVIVPGLVKRNYKVSYDFTSSKFDFNGASLIDSIAWEKMTDEDGKTVRDDETDEILYQLVLTIKENLTTTAAKEIAGAIVLAGKTDDVADIRFVVTGEVANEVAYIDGAKKAADAEDITESMLKNYVLFAEDAAGYVEFTDGASLTGLVKVEKDEKAQVYFDTLTEAEDEAIEAYLGEDYEAIVEEYKFAGTGFKNEVAFQYDAWEEDPHFFYAWDGEKFVDLEAKYDADEDVDNYVFTADAKGIIVVTDVEIVAGAADTKNPDTGANDVVGVAAALAVVSLVAAGAVSLKK